MKAFCLETFKSILEEKKPKKKALGSRLDVLKAGTGDWYFWLVTYQRWHFLPYAYIILVKINFKIWDNTLLEITIKRPKMGMEPSLVEGAIEAIQRMAFPGR